MQDNVPANKVSGAALIPGLTDLAATQKVAKDPDSSFHVQLYTVLGTATLPRVLTLPEPVDHPVCEALLLPRDLSREYSYGCTGADVSTTEVWLSTAAGLDLAETCVSRTERA